VSLALAQQNTSPQSRGSTTRPRAELDLTKQHALIGGTRVHWKDGMRRMVAHVHPEIALKA
jgi:hypothetical protein